MFLLQSVSFFKTGHHRGEGSSQQSSTSFVFSSLILLPSWYFPKMANANCKVLDSTISEVWIFIMQQTGLQPAFMIVYLIIQVHSPAVHFMQVQLPKLNPFAGLTSSANKGLDALRSSSACIALSRKAPS